MQDTESFYTIVQQKILQRFGKEFTWELKAKMMGQKALEAAETLVADLGLEGQLKPEDFVKEREEMLQTMFPEAKLLPGVEKLIHHLKEHNVCPTVTFSPPSSPPSSPQPCQKHTMGVVWLIIRRANGFPHLLTNTRVFYKLVYRLQACEY
jgi:beta-phosphoglucomutase-like phosphatase (HAD superfamily)